MPWFVALFGRDSLIASLQNALVYPDFACAALDVLENESEETPDSGLMNDSLRREVQRALSTLTQREADVITLYFGLNGEHAMTLEEIGEKFNLTRERVRQIKEKAIRRLRHTSRSKALKPYLG